MIRAISILCLAVVLTAAPGAAEDQFNWDSIADGVTGARLQKHVESLASFGSRIPGYQGHDRALEYVRGEFARMGYTRIDDESFPVTVPVDEGSSLEIPGSGQQFTIHALWPNLVRTAKLPPGGLTGTALDGRKGNWSDFNGKAVKDGIIFMDFNSESNWLNAAMLGAAAIVFVEPERTVRRQAETKIARVPLNVPRFWISRTDYEGFAQSGMGKKVRLTCKMEWHKVNGRNLLVRLQGTGPAETRKLVCIQSYYDSMSVVPALAPGAEAACGMAAMLEIARVFKANPPECDVLFLATSGHHMANAGIMDFMHRHARKRSPFREETKDPIHPDLMFCLDITSRNQTIGVTYQDGIRALYIPDVAVYNLELGRHAKRFCSYAERLGPVLDEKADDLCLNVIVPEGGGDWRSFLPEEISLDGAVAVIGATAAVTFVTTHDPRLSIDTPLDEARGVIVSNLLLQTRFLACALLMGLDDPELLGPSKIVEDKLRRFRGRLVTFDPTKSFMPEDPVPGGIGRIRLGATVTLLAEPVGVRGTLLALTDDDGWFEVPVAVNGPVRLEGYDFDPDTGDIVKAVDLGLEGASQFPVDVNLNQWIVERKNIVLFDCRSTDLYDLVDPRYLIAMDKLLIFDAGNAEPFAYGYCLDELHPVVRTSRGAPYASVFTRPGVPIKIGVSSDVLGQRMLFLNAPSAGSRKESEGLGYPVGQIRLIDNSSYQVLRDMYNLDEFRMQAVKRHGIENRRLERLHDESGKALRNAEKAAKGLQWDRFMRYARRGLGIESRAYPDVRSTSDDVVYGIVFYMALLLPFALFCERLFFAYPDLKRRIIAFVGFFLLTYMMLRLVHPAFKIVETSEIILLGLVIFALCGIVVAISAGRFEAQMRALKQQRGRVHHADVSRTSATATAFALGVSNMRRRKVRTFLTCMAIVLLMFTVISFTSVKTYLRPRKLARSYPPAYQGALIRDRTWVPMKHLAFEHLQSEFADSGTLVRRSWLVPRKISATFTQLSICVRPVTEKGFGPERIRAFALAGFDPEESEVTGINTTLKAGRWFRPGERDVCILPDHMADKLNIDPEDCGTARVHLLGASPTVIGIVDNEQYNAFRDLDNEPLTPLDFTRLNRQALARVTGAGKNVSAMEGRAALETFVHIDVRNVVLMPYETVLDAGGALQGVAVKFHTGTVSEHIERLLDRLAVTIFSGEGDKVMVCSSLASSSIGGMGNIIIPVLIAALMVLNTMSGSVHERLNEIGTYSSVGLAPTHIGALFLAEACVYAILGGIAGYVIGQAVTKGLSLVGGLKGLTLNYSSLSSVVATLVVMVTVVASTLYPARMAARMAVPDITRRWVLPDPEGDVWKFDFPFTVGGNEVAGLYVFFRYYFASFEEQSVGRFYTTSTDLSRSGSGEQQGYQLTMRVWLSPYDLGVSQDMEMHAIPTGDAGIYSIQLRIRRLSGQATTWVRINRGFLDEIRKQFLVWRTIPPEGKAEYGAEANKAFA